MSLNTFKTGAQIVVESLERHGVTHVFGIPGAKIDKVFDTLKSSSIETVVCRHEQNAAFIAGGIGRLTGKVGVAIATSGPGVSNLTTGLATANSEGDPIVADWRKNAHDGFPHNRDGSPSYAAAVDFLGHKDLGEKTMLFLIDGLYGNENADPPPSHKWKMAPFNDAWPSSIFMSLDGVAIDSVGFDFLTTEWPNLVDIANADNYLREAALANDAPSKTVYDPERDGIRCRSLGVFEHWNNGTDKKYSGNLGKVNGIELFRVG